MHTSSTRFVRHLAVPFLGLLMVCALLLGIFGSSGIAHASALTPQAQADEIASLKTEALSLRQRLYQEATT